MLSAATVPNDQNYSQPNSHENTVVNEDHTQNGSQHVDVTDTQFADVSFAQTPSPTSTTLATSSHEKNITLAALKLPFARAQKSSPPTAAIPISVVSPAYQMLMQDQLIVSPVPTAAAAAAAAVSSPVSAPSILDSMMVRPLSTPHLENRQRASSAGSFNAHDLSTSTHTALSTVRVFPSDHMDESFKHGTTLTVGFYDPSIEARADRLEPHFYFFPESKTEQWAKDYPYLDAVKEIIKSHKDGEAKMLEILLGGKDYLSLQQDSAKEFNDALVVRLDKSLGKIYQSCISTMDTAVKEYDDGDVKGDAEFHIVSTVFDEEKLAKLVTTTLDVKHEEALKEFNQTLERQEEILQQQNGLSVDIIYDRYIVPARDYYTVPLQKEVDALKEQLKKKDIQQCMAYCHAELGKTELRLAKYTASRRSSSIRREEEKENKNALNVALANFAIDHPEVYQKTFKDAPKDADVLQRIYDTNIRKVNLDKLIDGTGRTLIFYVLKELFPLLHAKKEDKQSAGEAELREMLQVLYMHGGTCYVRDQDNFDPVKYALKENRLDENIDFKGRRAWEWMGWRDLEISLERIPSFSPVANIIFNAVKEYISAVIQKSRSRNETILREERLPLVLNFLGFCCEHYRQLTDEGLRNLARAVVYRDQAALEMKGFHINRGFFFRSELRDKLRSALKKIDELKAFMLPTTQMTVHREANEAYKRDAKKARSDATKAEQNAQEQKLQREIEQKRREASDKTAAEATIRATEQTARATAEAARATAEAARATAEATARAVEAAARAAAEEAARIAKETACAEKAIAQEAIRRAEASAKENEELRKQIAMMKQPSASSSSSISSEAPNNRDAAARSISMLPAVGVFAQGVTIQPNNMNNQINTVAAPAIIAADTTTSTSATPVTLTPANP